MPLVLKDRVKETTSTTGTGTLALLGASQGYQGFSTIGVGNTTYYCIQATSDWEVGLGTVGPGTLSRDSVLASSGGGTLVSFGSGVKDVFCTYPASKAIGTDIGPMAFSSSTVSPNDTVNVASIKSAVASTDGDVALVPKGFGAVLAQVPDGTVANGNKRGGFAVDWQTYRPLADAVASGNGAVISGGAGNKASGELSAVSGGLTNYATAAYSNIGGGALNQATARWASVSGGYNNTATEENTFIGSGISNVASALAAVVVGGESNAASQQYSVIVGGRSNLAQNLYAFVGGGIENTSSGEYSATVGGYLNIASGNYSFIGGGVGNRANSTYSAVLGGAYGTTRGVSGYHAFPACIAPIAVSAGASQGGLLILGRQTTNGTSVVLRSTSAAADTTNQIILPNNSAFYFRGTVIANVTGGGNTKSWTFDGQIKRGANAASTTLTGSTVTSPYGDAGASTWTVALSADTTNGGLAVTVTGQASTTIRWVCRIETTEVTY